MQGETLKVLRALEAVVSHLRKFLVDHSVLPLFEKTVSLNCADVFCGFFSLHCCVLIVEWVHLQYTAPISQERQPDPWADKSLLHTATQTVGGTGYPPTATRDSLFLRETQLESQLPSSGLSIYGQEAALSSLRSSGLGRPGAPIVTQVRLTVSPF